MNEKIIEIGILRKELIVLTNKGRLLQQEMTYDYDTGNPYNPKWVEIELPDFKKKIKKQVMLR